MSYLQMAFKTELTILNKQNYGYYANTYTHTWLNKYKLDSIYVSSFLV